MPWWLVLLLVILLPAPEVYALQEAACVPQVTSRLDALLWWEPAPATSGASLLTGYRVQRQVDGQRQWQDVVDLPATVVTYPIDGVRPPVKPGHTYFYRVLALWQPPSGAVLVSGAGPAGEPAPCLEILVLPPPGLLRATVQP